MSTKSIWRAAALLALLLPTSCTSPQTQPPPAPSEAAPPVVTDPAPASLPNPASVYCEQQGYQVEVRTATAGSQSGVCIFPDGSECDEWAYFRGECGPATLPPSQITAAPSEIPTALPIDRAGYQGWWTYTHAVYGFSIMLPEDWVVEEVTTSDPLMNGHTLNLHPRELAPGMAATEENVRLAFRRLGEASRLWPTGVGQGEFTSQGTLDVAGHPAQRLLLVCPTGEITAIWYHGGEGQPNIVRGDLEYGFIFSATPTHCQAGQSLGGKVQRVGEMIIASLTVP